LSQLFLPALVFGVEFISGVLLLAILLSITNGSAGKRSQFVDRRPHGNYALKFIFHSKALPDGMDEFAALRKLQTIAISRVGFRVADNPGVDSATRGLSQVDYGAENGAGKRWV